MYSTRTPTATLTFTEAALSRWRTLAPLMLAWALAGTAGAAHANEALARKHNCLNCHGIDKRTGFPAPIYKDVAKRYAGQASAPDQLAKKIRTGGNGSWGMAPMPANPKVSEAEAKQLAAWVLSIK